MQFASIPEYDFLKKNLLHMVALGRVAHAQLFIGSTGSAHLALALAFATYLNCFHRTTTDACGHCPSCSKMVQLTHPDVQFLFPGKEKTAEALQLFRNTLKENPFLSLEEWMHALHYDSKQCQITRKDTNTLIQHLGLKAFLGKYKIILIWLPEYLNNTAANALLKILEEPPIDTVFLLVSSHSEKILSTIRSRSQQHYIAPFSEKAIIQILSDNYPNLETNRYKAIAFAAEGNINRAFQWMETSNIDHFERFSTWMRSCYSSNYAIIIAQAETFHKLSTDAQKSFVSYMLQWIRIILLKKLNHTPPLLTESREATFSQKFALTVTVIQLKKIISLLTKAYTYLERNAHAKMVYTHLSIQIARIFKDVD